MSLKEFVDISEVKVLEEIKVSEEKKPEDKLEEYSKNLSNQRAIIDEKEVVNLGLKEEISKLKKELLFKKEEKTEVSEVKAKEDFTSYSDEDYAKKVLEIGQDDIDEMTDTQVKGLRKSNERTRDLEFKFEELMAKKTEVKKEESSAPEEVKEIIIETEPKIKTEIAGTPAVPAGNDSGSKIDKLIAEEEAQNNS